MLCCKYVYAHVFVCKTAFRPPVECQIAMDPRIFMSLQMEIYDQQEN